MTKRISITAKSPSKDLNDIRRKVFVLAHQIIKHNPRVTLKKALEYCWKTLPKSNHTYIIYFTKHNQDGSIKEHCKRLVQIDTTGHLTFKGTGRPLKPGQRLFVDVARAIVKKMEESKYGESKLNTIISTYENRITAIF